MLDCVLSIRYCVQCVLNIMCCVWCVLSIMCCFRCVLSIRCCARLHLVCCEVGLLRPESRLAFWRSGRLTHGTLRMQGIIFADVANSKHTATYVAPTHAVKKGDSRTSTIDKSLLPSISKQPSRPNTGIHYQLFTEHNLPMPTGQLKVEGWKQLTLKFPNQEVVAAILGICQFGAKIGYEGRRSGITIYPNLSTANTDARLVTAEVASELNKNRLEEYQDSGSLPDNYTVSPLGLTDNSGGSKRRIHHLTYPSAEESSINSGIHEAYGVIQYCGIEDAIRAVQTSGRNCILIKRDFESAFPHIPILPEDSPLLGFHWQNGYYTERFLPSGLMTAPYLFNLFAEVFH